MASKQRLKPDAFDWVKDTTKETEDDPSLKRARRKQAQPKTAPKAAKKKASATKASQSQKKTAPSGEKAAKESQNKTVAKPQPETAAQKRPAPAAPFTTGTSELARKVFVKYDKRNGRIIAMRETSAGFNVPSEVIWKDISLDEEVATLLLTDKLAGLRLVDLHTGYRITKSGSSTILTQKS